MLPDPQERPTISVKEAAEILGVSLRVCYSAIEEGTVPGIKLGGRIVVPTAKLLSLLGYEPKL